MTSLPEAPNNFDSISIETPEELQKAQEQLEETKKKIEELLLKLETYAALLQNITLTSSEGAKLKQKIVKEVVDAFLKIKCPGFELPLLQLSILINSYLLALNLPTLPVIPDTLKLTISIPIELPTVADFKRYINQKIEEAKQRCQRAAIKKQIEDAKKEKTPFTNRKTESVPSRVVRNPIAGRSKLKYLPTQEDMKLLEDLNDRCCDCEDELK